ncbi:hypothetical protein VTK73DRAFT_7955 [Phialemonium thermophilum]|uniref:Crossover junction endonuclease MUS81 n=1 Tax=Phialemonium thermophilum TaxID=223376 RepID=A0ABR3XSF7_9PEZI
MSEDEGCPNPLLLAWVKDWYDTARERNSKGATAYRRAYDSLKACPIAFEHPSQLQQLKGFGPKLCDRLTDKLKKHCQENGLPMPEHPGLRKNAGNASTDQDDDSVVTRPAKRPKRAKAYVPAYRSGPYALLLALSTLNEDNTTGMTKAELIEEAQQHCDASFTAPSDTTKFYTAWNSMKTLIQKELVFERGRPLKRYCLTDEGWEVAKRIKQTTQGNSSATEARADGARPELPSVRSAAPPDFRSIALDLDEEEETSEQSQNFGNVVRDDTDSGESTTLPDFTPIRLEPGSFSVRLVLDVREVRAKTDRDYMQEELAKRGVKCIMRSLDLGDAIWVAKCHDPDLLSRLGAEGDEVVLDYILERKRLDDLIGSIKDGRFHEQKFRLRRSGIRNVVYLVEEISMDSGQYQKYEEAVESAIASTQVVNGYFLKRTQTMDDSIRYLTRMTMLLKKIYEGKPLHVIPTRVLTTRNYLPLLSHLRETKPSMSFHITYPPFASLASKSDTMTLRDVFLKMLMCTKGVTGEKAIEIQRRWKTPYDFVKAFERCGPGEEGNKRKRDMVSKEMAHLIGRKKVAKVVSQKIAEVWGNA